jgi:predicted RNA-binding Zn-ribbon protein involved in translation (DUF1610 family)
MLLLRQCSITYVVPLYGVDLTSYGYVKMVTEKAMQSDSALEYMCPHCGTINELRREALRDMYHEQHETCDCCKKMLSLTPADGIGGRVNLVIDAIESDKAMK